MTVKKIHQLPRLYIKNLLAEGSAITLGEGPTHQLANVLRLNNDDEIRVFDEEAGEFLASLELPKKKNAIVHLKQQLQESPPASKPLWLYFAPIKKSRMDFLIEKAAELGVTDIQPVLTDRTEVRDLNYERITAQLVEAIEQCEAFHVPRLHKAIPLKNINASHKIYAALERRHATPLQQAITAHKEDAAGLLIGPEGGFTENETEWLEKTPGFVSVSLGDRILRAETAALYGLSLLI
ncbi:MAG: RsmE family RNA methyltransferase [Alphaproteobacteria bacterium]|nr:RsmE family RNA methyltransferase [Alphaproteobacteria bacterium]